MAKVTMELRKVLEIENFNLFDFDYVCDDLAWKAKLEQQFIDTYYFCEIGQETIDRWKHYVRNKFVTIMPYYNELYKSTLITINPLLTHRRSETYEGTNSSTNNSTSTDESKDFEYPQNANPATDIASGKNNATGTSTGNASGQMDYEKIIEGFDGNQAELLKAYRDNMVRVNETIMKECKDLFILVY